MQRNKGNVNYAMPYFNIQFYNERFFKHEKKTEYYIAGKGLYLKKKKNSQTEY